MPADPKAWLVTIAARKVIDAQRSDLARRRREEAATYEREPGPTEQADNTLLLLFLCCHPALNPASAVALTLRAVGGLTTKQIADAFLVPEAGDGPTDQPSEADPQQRRAARLAPTTAVASSRSMSRTAPTGTPPRSLTVSASCRPPSPEIAGRVPDPGRDRGVARRRPRGDGDRLPADTRLG